MTYRPGLLMALLIALPLAGPAGAIDGQDRDREPGRKQAVAESDAERPSRDFDENDERFADTEAGCPDARIQDYLFRHGDLGVMDPESLLWRTRELKQALERDRSQFAADAIGGTAWTTLGPNNGAGRAVALAIHPTVPGTVIIGAAGGGAWRTTDFGASWTALTETIANLSVGAIAYAPSDPNLVYLGSGEGGNAIDFIPGFGLLYSTDGGNNWTLPSFVLASQFYRISVDPRDKNTLVVGTNAGAFRSTNGPDGPWTEVIHSASSSDTIGYRDVAEIARDPSNPDVLYATTYDRLRWCAKNSCTDPGNFVSPTVLKSTDGGATWSPAATGLPQSTATLRVNRMSLATAPTSTKTLYLATSIFDNNTSLERSHIYKSVDGAATWTETALNQNTSLNTYFNTQAWYDNTIVVSPTDPNLVLAGGVTYVKTTDGGATWVRPAMSGVHVDAHDLRYDGTGILWIANDGGIWTTADNGATATNRNNNLVTRQYYALTNDPVHRNRVFGGMQDNGSNRRPDGGGTSWDSFTGGDGFGCAVNQAVPEFVFTTSQGEVVHRCANGGSTTPIVTDRSPIFDGGEVTPFLSKILFDPNFPNLAYAISYRLWRTTDGGETWTPVPTATTDGTKWSTTSTITAVAISRSNSQIIMVANGSRQIFRTTNGGLTWEMATAGLPTKSVVGLEIDPIDSNRVYAALAGTTGTSVYITLDGGANWVPRGLGLPSFSAQVVRVDPTDPSTLYCGTDVGVYRSTDGGNTWSRFGTGMPAVSVYDLQPLSDGSMLRAATHGRGIWELNVTGVTNHAPNVTILAPTIAPTVAKGSTVSFTGGFTDPDGDTVRGLWTFPDNWTSVPAGSGVAISHGFQRAGIFPVTYTATDSHGAIGAATVYVTTTESGDFCNNPVVIPPAGPFPYSLNLNLEGTTTEPTDPNGSGTTSCYPFRPQNSAWLAFTPAVTDTYQFSLCGSRTSAALIGYTGSSCGPYTLVPGLCVVQMTAANNCATAPASTATLNAGTTYRMMLTNYFTRDLGPVTVTVSRSGTLAPVATTVSPVAGPTTGQTAVIITGSGFGDGTTVKIGGVDASSVQVLSSFILSATTPVHPSGTVDVTVTTGGSTSTLGNAFTFITETRRRPVAH